MEKNIYIFTKNVYFECFISLLHRKMTKYMQSTLHGEIKRHYEKRVLRVFSIFGTKKITRLSSTLYGGKETTLQKKKVYFE